MKKIKMLTILAVVAAALTGCGFENGKNSGANLASINLTSADTAFKVSVMKHKATTKNVGPKDSVLNGALNVASFADIEAGEYVANLDPVDSAFESINELDLVVGVGANDDFVVEFHRKDGNVTPVDIDLTNLIATANTAGGEIDTACNALVTATSGFEAGTVSRDALVAALGACVGKKTSAAGIWNSLSQGLNQASATNPKRAEAQTALDSLKGKIEAAETAIAAAEAALNQAPAIEGTVKASALTEDSAGQLAEGVTIKVGSTPSDEVTCVTAAGSLVCEYNLAPGTYSVVASKTGYVTRNSLITVVENGTSQVQLYLPKVPANQPQPGDLVAIADFVMAKGSTLDMAGLFKKYNASLVPVALPDAEVSLAVVTGSSVTVSGLVLTASSTTTGGTKIRWTWNGGTPADTSDDKSLEFTVVVY